MVRRVRPRVDLSIVPFAPAVCMEMRDVGTPVFFGMIAASTIGILLIPMLYLVFQWLRESVKARLLGLRPSRHPLPGE